jgi:mono/diheme cytochrome c family protein
MNMNTLCGLIGAALFFVNPLASSAATVLDKVYTAPQAERGAEAYQTHCAKCHEGAEPDAPAPKGQPFIDRWREAPLDLLYTHIRTKMPGDAPGTLSQDVYLDILAYLLRENGYPPGSSALSTDQLGNILLTGPEGPQPLPPDSLVRVVGCLTPAGSSDEWKLTSATPPARVTEADQTTAEETAKSAATPPGSATYILRNAEDQHADTIKGQRVQAKGVLSGQGDKISISVQSLARAGASCEK